MWHYHGILNLYHICLLCKTQGSLPVFAPFCCVVFPVFAIHFETIQSWCSHSSNVHGVWRLIHSYHLRYKLWLIRLIILLLLLLLLFCCLNLLLTLLASSILNSLHKAEKVSNLAFVSQPSLNKMSSSEVPQQNYFTILFSNLCI